LYVSSNDGIHKINTSGDNLILFDVAISGPINSIFERNNNFKIKFIDQNGRRRARRRYQSLSMGKFRRNFLFGTIVCFIAIVVGKVQDLKNYIEYR